MSSISVSDPVASPRVRFAPSPTGYLHVGGARTALFNWLFARHFGGTLVLRIEDTDVERSTPGMVEGILQGLSWLGLDWDEGPYYQTQRLNLYLAAADRLIESGAAYYCFCSKEDLEQRRKKAAEEGRPPKYEGTCRKLDRAEASRRKAAGELAAVRFAIPEAGGTSFDDAVFGKVEFANSELEDFVLLRSDGTPEILGDAELVRLFGLEGISRSNAVFNRAKLDWFNSEYIRRYPAERLLPLIEEEWQKAGLQTSIPYADSAQVGTQGSHLG